MIVSISSVFELATMGDSMTSITGEPRMLERRISNQRAELNNDQQMNYLLAWFNNWSDLQKEDFVPVLAEKMSSKWAAVNGLTEDMKSMAVINSGRPVSLFQCQVCFLQIVKLSPTQSTSKIGAELSLIYFIYYTNHHHPQ